MTDAQIHAAQLKSIRLVRKQLKGVRTLASALERKLLSLQDNKGRLGATALTPSILGWDEVQKAMPAVTAAFADLAQTSQL
jgi:hypothetical protein